MNFITRSGSCAIAALSVATLPLGPAPAFESANRPHAAIVRSTPFLTFATLGSAGTQSFSVSEAGYTGAFKATSSNKAVATVASSANGSFEVTAAGAGKASAIVSDAKGQKVAVAVYVSATTLTLRDLPATMRSVRVETDSTQANKRAVTQLALSPNSKGCVKSRTGSTCVVTVGVLPGSDVLTLTVYESPGAQGIVDLTTSVQTVFPDWVHNAFSLSNARYVKYAGYDGSAQGSVTAGTGGDPHVYFIGETPNDESTIVRWSADGAYEATSNGAGRASVAAGKAGSGLIWYAANRAVGSLAATGKRSVYPTTFDKTCHIRYEPYSIATGPDGNPWFTETLCHASGIATLRGGKIYDFPFPVDRNKNPVYSVTPIAQDQIVSGRDGNLWIALAYCGLSHSVCAGVGASPALVRVNPRTGSPTFYVLGKSYDSCLESYLADGGDGNVWLATCSPKGQTASTLIRVTPAGSLTAFGGVTTGVDALAEGADGNLYFTDQGELGRFVTRGPELGRVDYYYPTKYQPSTNGVGQGNDGYFYVTNNGGIIYRVAPPSP
jgi:hypothetical protein